MHRLKTTKALDNANLKHLLLHFQALLRTFINGRLPDDNGDLEQSHIQEILAQKKYNQHVNTGTYRDLLTFETSAVNWKRIVQQSKTSSTKIVDHDDETDLDALSWTLSMPVLQSMLKQSQGLQSTIPSSNAIPLRKALDAADHADAVPYDILHDDAFHTIQELGKDMGGNSHPPSDYDHPSFPKLKNIEHIDKPIAKNKTSIYNSDVMYKGLQREAMVNVRRSLLQGRNDCGIIVVAKFLNNNGQPIVGLHVFINGISVYRRGIIVEVESTDSICRSIPILPGSFGIDICLGAPRTEEYVYRHYYHGKNSAKFKDVTFPFDIPIGLRMVVGTQLFDTPLLYIPSATLPVHPFMTIVLGSNEKNYIDDAATPGESSVVNIDTAATGTPASSTSSATAGVEPSAVIPVPAPAAPATAASTNHPETSDAKEPIATPAPSPTAFATPQYPNIWVMGDSIARWYAVQVAHRISLLKGGHSELEKWNEAKQKCHKPKFMEPQYDACTLGAGGVYFGWLNWFGGKGYIPFDDTNSDKPHVGWITQDLCSKDIREEEHCNVEHPAPRSSAVSMCGMDACLTYFFCNSIVNPAPTTKDVLVVRIGLLYLAFSEKSNAKIARSTMAHPNLEPINIDQTMRADLLSFIAPLHRAFKGKIIWMLLAPVSQEFGKHPNVTGQMAVDFRYDYDLDVGLVNKVLKEVLVEQKQEHIIDPTPFHTEAFMKSTTPTLDVGDGHEVEGYIDPFHFGGSALDKTIDAIFEEIKEIDGFHVAAIPERGDAKILAPVVPVLPAAANATATPAPSPSPTTFCIINWKKHNVKPGVTWEEKPWGTLPVVLRKEWLQRGCNEIVGKQK